MRSRAVTKLDSPHRRSPPDWRGLTIRFTEELRQRLVAEARAAERSLNSEIIYRLRKSLESSSGLGNT
jgi:hypothetical protein